MTAQECKTVECHFGTLGQLLVGRFLEKMAKIAKNQYIIRVSLKTTKYKFILLTICNLLN